MKIFEIRKGIMQRDKTIESFVIAESDNMQFAKLIVNALNNKNKLGFEFYFTVEVNKKK